VIREAATNHRTKNDQRSGNRSNASQPHEERRREYTVRLIRRRWPRDLSWRALSVRRLRHLLLALLIHLLKLSLTFLFSEGLGTDLCAFPRLASLFRLSVGTAVLGAFLIFPLLLNLGLSAALICTLLRFPLLFGEGLGTTLLLRAYLRFPFLFDLLSGRLRKGTSQRTRSKR
jgi:hypothetical protein